MKILFSNAPGLVLQACVFLFLLAANSQSLADSSVRSLNLHKIKGKVGVDIYDINAGGADEFTRLTHLLALAEFGNEFLNMYDSGSDSYIRGTMDCVLAIENLKDSARDDVLKKGGRDCSLRRYGQNHTFGWKGDNVLDREDSQARFRSKYLPDIMAAAKKVAAMNSVREVNILELQHIYPQKYSRDKQAFELYIGFGEKQYMSVLRVKNAKAVRYWPVPESQARKLMAGPFKQPAGTQLRLLTTLRLGKPVKTAQSFFIPVTIESAELYLKNDKQLAKPVHRYAKADFTDQAAIAREQEAERIARMEKLPMADESYLWAAYADLTGQSVDEVVETFISRLTYHPDPFKAKRAKDKDRRSMRAVLEKALADYQRNRPVWIQGTISFNTYDMDGGFFPVREVKPKIVLPPGITIHQLGLGLVGGQMERLPVPEDIAEGLASRGYAPFRARVYAVEAGGYEVRVAVDRIELLRDEAYADILYDKNLLWEYTPVSYAKLQEKAAVREQNLAALKKECEASGSSACYQKLCAGIKATASREEYKACRKQQAAALARERRAEIAASSAGLAAKQGAGMQDAETQARTNSLGDCDRKYGGYQAQGLMPVSGTPEYEAAIAHCLKQPVREPYGRDILGLRLGMPSNDANRLLQRQPYERNVLAEDSRPFEKAQLAISGDNNDGLAAFFLRNGNVDRVAAVSRRVYFEEGKMQAARLQQGLRKKYGKESWSGGEAMMWLDPSAEASPASCSGLVSMVEERGGWRAGGWVLKGRSKASRGNASMAIGMQAGMRAGAIQQECMSRYGMPSGGADMQAQIQQFQRCMEEKMAAVGAGAGATADSVMADSADKERRPHAVKMTADPARYARYKACGPVVIALFNKSKGGSVKDLSLVLFDPEWVSRQPAFAFRQENSGELNF